MSTAIWRALPELCPDLLPGGYASLGFITEPGANRPIGITERTVGVSRAAFNCATCHAGTVRTSDGAEPQVIVGMPAHRVDIQRYTQFMGQCIGSDRFTAALAMPVIRRLTPMSGLEAAFLRYVIIPATKREVAVVKAKFAWFERPSQRPRSAIGFDFDGAEFTHVKNRVTYEVLMESFGLESDPALVQIGAAVHFLDVGGIPVADARGLETMLRGIKEKAKGDDAWQPAPRKRTITMALKAYAALTTSAARGAVRDVRTKRG